MPEVQTQTIQPDVAFVRELMNNGGDSLKKCFQCGNCSVVCNISPDNQPFPRKEMIWAQWGLKDKLVANADIWLCHNCNDCSTHCPRGAKPGDVMAAIRNTSFARLAGFEFMGTLLQSPVKLPLLFAVPAILIAVVIAMASKKDFLSIQPIVFSNMMPVSAIDFVFLPAVGFAVIAAIMGAKKFWNEMSRSTPDRSSASGSFFQAATAVLVGILKHEKLAKCETNAPRFKSHLFTMYGFIMLFITTNIVAAMYYLTKFGIADFVQTPLPLSHPVKILGNLGAIFAVTGVTLIVHRRYAFARKDVGKSSYYDNHFIFILYGTILTGILAELIRLGEATGLAFAIYYIHLILVFVLLVYGPFSKFAHIIYRFLAMTYSKMIERDRARS
ncbi:MAG TPA: quinone-interacting membrane-bound oxidoreductase complex subunit QmoC [Nitrospinota bacterium]|nr:quinone-interacting membrane-bound oxidoreductase complex subunit QmoC [Nitrospinota bacterium]|tara:strand:- start:17239 stop:18396 length:1158 start_codon:yes stop_codon:yes gene_type:complete